MAAVQVVLLHSLTAFAPGFAISPYATGTVAAYVRASPLFFLYDGYSAVYIFFILSGYVLTRSFQDYRSNIFFTVIARYIRLALPALVACAVSAVSIWLFAASNVPAGALVKSAWLQALVRPELSFYYLLKDGLLNSVLLGYTSFGPFNSLGRFQDPITQAFSFPLWTLSWEFYGSLLTFGLVAISRKSHKASIVVAVVAAAYLSRSAFLCFVVGYLAAVFRMAEEPPRLNRYAALVLLALGIAACVAAENWTPGWLNGFCALKSRLIVRGADAYHLQKIFGAIAIFCAVVQLDWIRQNLCNQTLVWFSTLSFPLYLVHPTVIFGPASAALIWLVSFSNFEIARAITLGLALVVSLLAAIAFRPIDQVSVRWSANIRRRMPAKRPADLPGMAT